MLRSDCDNKSLTVVFVIPPSEFEKYIFLIFHNNILFKQKKQGLEFFNVPSLLNENTQRSIFSFLDIVSKASISACSDVLILCDLTMDFP